MIQLFPRAVTAFLKPDPPAAPAPVEAPPADPTMSELLALPPEQPGPLGRFALWLAGANPDLIVTRSERVEYTAAGIAVAATATMAAVSMAFALTVALKVDQAVAATAGFGWGLMIANLDRWVVSSPKDPSQPRLGRWLQVAARMLMAITLGVVISEPLVLRLYEPEINAQLEHEATQAELAARRDAEALVATKRDQLAQQRDTLATAVTDAQQAVQTADAALAAAVADSGATRPSEYGPAAARHNHDAHRARARLVAAQDQQRTQTDRLDAETARLDELAEAEYHRLVAAERDRTGLLAREHALHTLTAANPTLAVSRWAITLLILLVDIAPVLLKTMRRQTGHDRLALALAAARTRTALANLQTATRIQLVGIMSDGRYQVEGLEAAGQPLPMAGLPGDSAMNSPAIHGADLRNELLAPEDASLLGDAADSPGGRVAAVYNTEPAPAGGWTSPKLADAADASQPTASRFLNDMLNTAYAAAPPESEDEAWTPELLAHATRVSVKTAKSFLRNKQQ